MQTETTEEVIFNISEADTLSTPISLETCELEMIAGSPQVENDPIPE